MSKMAIINVQSTAVLLCLIALTSVDAVEEPDTFQDNAQRTHVLTINEAFLDGDEEEEEDAAPKATWGGDPDEVQHLDIDHADDPDAEETLGISIPKSNHVFLKAAQEREQKEKKRQEEKRQRQELVNQLNK